MSVLITSTIFASYKKLSTWDLHKITSLSLYFENESKKLMKWLVLSSTNFVPLKGGVQSLFENSRNLCRAVFLSFHRAYHRILFTRLKKINEPSILFNFGDGGPLTVRSLFLFWLILKHFEMYDFFALSFKKNYIQVTNQW